MIGVIKELCIFMMIAQAVLLFVPGNTYVKYVRVLVGIMMIMGITGPLFGLFMDEGKKREIQERAAEMEKSLSMESSKLTLPEHQLEIYEGIERELAKRLEACEGNYRVSDVELLENEVIVTVHAKGKTEEAQGQIRIAPVVLGEEEEKDEKIPDEEELKNLYGNQIGVDAEKIKIVLQ